MPTVYPSGIDPRRSLDLGIQSIVLNQPQVVAEYLDKPYPVRVLLTRNLTEQERKQADRFRPTWTFDGPDELLFVCSLEDFLDQNVVDPLIADLKWLQAEGRALAEHEVEEHERQRLLVDRVNAYIDKRKKATNSARPT